ncbi:VWA domain-containing protein [Legionella israelensis]|uniref:VWA domain-containing protein n=1 Tax=Legionella israelensis TaxID=454 RepID=A0AAX1EDE2_9GAMM|nr:VWA domain-containing protein [Legionella israelensis]QBR83126.1 VWA domain-containing protein [Legionella israelensis]
MITDFHFLRPLWLLALIPLAFFAVRLWQQKNRLQTWNAICDSHLLKELIQVKERPKDFLTSFFLLTSGLFFILSLAGPSWLKLAVPVFQPIEPRVIVLDLSHEMLNKDLSPDRLSRAKFKLHDLFQHSDKGQWGMVVYTGEPFVVSPLTDDAQTITNLLSTLTPDIMPVGGHQLDTALDQAAKLIDQAGYQSGQILVLTGTPPHSQAIQTAEKLSQHNIYTSILPLSKDKSLNPLYQQLAHAGHGQLLHLTPDDSDIVKWLNDTQLNKKFALSQYNDVPLWRDEGRWFLIPALLFFLPLFRRGNLQRIIV